jgi:hypothetical protein
MVFTGLTNEQAGLILVRRRRNTRRGHEDPQILVDSLDFEGSERSAFFQTSLDVASRGGECRVTIPGETLE